MKVFWRYRKDVYTPWTEAWLISKEQGLVFLGRYETKDALYGCWVSEDEVDIKERD